MKTLGFLLIGLGFAGGTVAAALDPAAVKVPAYVGALVLGAAGAVFVRLGARAVARDEGRRETNLRALKESLTEVILRLEEIDGGKDRTDVYDFPAWIDAARPAIERFIEARESIEHVAGVIRYGEVMSEFAAGERLMNRVWSTAAEGYIDEAHASLARSLDHFRAADALVAELPR